MRYSNNVIQWARQHDWFARSDTLGNLWVIDHYLDREGYEHKDLIKFEGSVRELRDWAGY